VFGKVGRGSDGKNSEASGRAGGEAGGAFAPRRLACRPVSERYIHRLRVRYGECDQQGVVFNAHYFAYFDHVLTEVWRDVVMPYNQMLEAGVDVVVAEARASFKQPARFDEEIDLQWWVTRLGNTAMTTRIDVMRGDDLLAEGELVHVYVDAGTSSKRAIPDEIRAALTPYFDGGGGGGPEGSRGKTAGGANAGAGG
jgi:acyl-CoA thioester hydrolase